MRLTLNTPKYSSIRFGSKPAPKRSNVTNGPLLDLIKIPEGQLQDLGVNRAAQWITSTWSQLPQKVQTI